MTASHDDDKMSNLLDKHGPEGYGIYWLIWEYVAAAVQKGKKPEVTYSLTEWSRRLHSHPNRVIKYLVTEGSRLGSGGCDLIVTEGLPDGRIRVSIPNILKYKDEYTRKSGECRDTKTDTDTDTDTDTEEMETDTKFSLLPFGEQALRPGVPADYQTVGSSLLNGNGARAKLLAEQKAFDEWFENTYWPKFPRKVGKAESKRAAAKKMTTPERRAMAMARLEFELPEMLSREPKFRPHASTWFNGDHWSDPLETDPIPNNAPLIPREMM